MGGKSPKIRDEKVLELNKEFHENYKNKDIIKKDISVLSIPISNAYVSDVKVYGTKSYSQIVKKDADISIETEREKKLVAPIKAGTVVGSYKVLINGEVVFKDDLIVKKDVEKKRIMDRIMEIF